MKKMIILGSLLIILGVLVPVFIFGTLFFMSEPKLADDLIIGSIGSVIIGVLVLLLTAHRYNNKKLALLVLFLAMVITLFVLDFLYVG